MLSIMLAATVAVSAAACSSPKTETAPAETTAQAVEAAAEQTKTEKPGIEVNAEAKPASQYTIDANKQVYAYQELDDKSEL